MKHSRLALLIGTALCMPAQAQSLATEKSPTDANAPSVSRSSEGVLVYEPSFFADASPANAYDMIRRVPGFVIVEPDDDVRGYSGAIGNVLIDGKPPSSKRDGLDAILRRIPADHVARIELVRGGAPGIAMGGNAVVANVVRASISSSHMAAEVGVAMTSDRIAQPAISVELSRQSANGRLEGAMGLESEVDDESGDGRIIVIAAASDPLEQRDFRQRETERTIFAKGEMETVLGSGELSANIGVEHERSRADVEVARLSPDVAGESTRDRETQLAIEVGARYNRPLGERGRIEALLLQRIGRLDGVSIADEDGASELFAEATRTRETIGRLSVRRESSALSLEAALEAADNRLESRTRLEKNGEVVAIPGSDAQVGEQRIEGLFSAAWRPRAGLVVEPSLRLEASTIQSVGDGAQKRSYVYLKPRLAVGKDIGRSGQLRLEVRRVVDQLDFDDFVASASLDRGQVTAGAVALRPPQSWVASVAFERRFWGDGAITLSYQHEWIDDVIDRVAIVQDGEILDAVGNIGSGSRATSQVSLSVPLSRLGLSGVLVRSAITVRKGRVTDPATGRQRAISDDDQIVGDIAVLQDLLDGKLSWGIDIKLGERKQEFRFDEILTETKGASFGFHVEYRPAPDWRLRFDAVNLTGRSITERSKIFDNGRTASSVSEIEDRRIRTMPQLSFTVSKSFGGQAR